MVQNVNSQNSSAYGKIDKVGNTPDGRVIYKVTNGNGEVSGGLSVAQKDCDTFEKNYDQLLNAAPKLEKYVKSHSEDDLKRIQKRGRRAILLSAFTGGLIPALFSHRLTEKLFPQILLTIGGTFAGLIAGAKVVKKTTAPPGAEEMTQASQAISKLDIQQIQV